MTQAEYIDLLFSAMDRVKTNVIEPVVGSSRIVTRYITSEGADDEQWLSHLRDDLGKTDIWLITANTIAGLSDNERAERAPVGTFVKPITLVVDFFYDYKQGLDYTEDVDGVTLTTNSEREFLEKLFAVDFALENKRGCLYNNIRINGWNFRLKIKQFSTSSTHWASGILNLEIQDIILS